MDEEKKGFNLNVLISMLVGVISLIVIIPTVTMIMSKNRPEKVTPEEYRIILNKNNYNFRLSFHGPSIVKADITGELPDFSLYDNLISLSITHDNFMIVVSYPDEGAVTYFDYLTIFSETMSSSNYAFTYLDPVSNDKLYGTYDFSNIIITEVDQVVNPIYTPFTTPYF